MVLERGCRYLATSEDYEAPVFQGDADIKQTAKKIFVDINLDKDEKDFQDAHPPEDNRQF